MRHELFHTSRSQTYLCLPQQGEHELVRVDDAGGRGEERLLLLFSGKRARKRVYMCVYVDVCTKARVYVCVCARMGVCMLQCAKIPISIRKFLPVCLYLGTLHIGLQRPGPLLAEVTYVGHAALVRSETDGLLCV